MDSSGTYESIGNIAIIGMSGRFPGANNLDEYWQNLRDGVESVSSFSEQELASSGIDPTVARDPRYVRAAAILENVEMFDAPFFGFSPKEAQILDPQQRLFMECAWEALETAGYNAETFNGQIAVYAGANISNYLLYNLYPRLGLNGFVENFQTLTGNAKDYLATRVSYKLKLTGPSISIQTACSTSLVSVCLACQSLLSYQCDMALAGGVTVRVPQKAGYLCESGGILSPDGHCRAFDARAQGTGLGSGLGIVVLKRLEDAMAAGDCIHAVIKGTAINNDGDQKIGYTAPSVEGQAKVIAMAQAVAGIKPETITYIEAHGTGTTLGDPIEIEALTRAFRAGTAAKGFCAIGSVKTNFGHLEAAAGIAGLIKTVLALKHKLLPPSLHFEQPNREIDFANTPFYVNARLAEWNSGGLPRRAGVSSFGIGGTNAHVILEEAPVRELVRSEVERPLHLLALSAKSDVALKELAAKYERHLGTETPDSLADICFTANTGRKHFGDRAAVIAESPAEAREKLARWVRGESAAGLLGGRVEGDSKPKVAFLFTGQGAQYVGMGRQLYETQPTFRKQMQRCDRLLRGELERPLLSVLYPEGNTSSPLDETAYTQAALFAFEYALAELWRSWGVKPAVVMGHSIGEYVAACVAGVFSLEDALKLVAERGRLMQRLPQDGAMVVVMADEERVRQAIIPHAEQVSIAAINGPDNVVISGAQERIKQITAQLEAQGVRTRPLTVSHAFHSPLMAPMLSPFERQAAQIRYSPPQVGLISNLTGALVQGAELGNAAYWVRHVREPVRFSTGMQTLRELGYEIFLEIGPKATLLGMGRHCLPEGTSLWLPSLRQDRGECRQMLESLGTLYVHGVEVDWSGFDRDFRRYRVMLPTYPFQRKRYWIEGAKPESKPSLLPGRSSGRSTHPLLGPRLRSPLREIQFELLVNSKSPALMEDHRIYGVPVFPAAGYLEMAQAAAAEVFGGKGNGASGPYILEDVVIHEPIVIAEEDEFRTVQLILTPEGDASASFQISSLCPEESDSSWILHAVGRVSVADPHSASSIQRHITREEIQARCREPVSSPELFYQRMAERGLHLGPGFQWIEKLWRRDGEALGEMRLPREGDGAERYQAHPGLMDSCFQLLAAALPAEALDTVYAPIGLKSLRFYGRSNDRVWGHAAVRQSDGLNPGTVVSDLCLFDESGQVLMEVNGLLAKRAPREALTRGRDRVSDWLYRVQWQPKPRLDERSSADYLPAPKHVAEYLEPLLEPLSRQHGLMLYEELIPEMDALGVAYIAEAFQQLGCEFRPGQRLGALTAARQMGVADQHRGLLERMLEMLEKGGLVKRVASEWEVLQLPSRNDPRERWSALMARYPAFGAELTLLERCGGQMAKVLRGERSPLEILFPGGSLATVEKLYQDSPVSRVCNTLIREAISKALQTLPKQRTVRLLEIGGGTGGTTSYLLADLQAYATEYVFTDVSPQFTSKAEQKFRHYPFMRYQVLDIERDPVAQGFAPHQFDLILAANVLHATSDLRRTLKHVQQLLAPEGMLFLLEGTGPQLWLDLIFGFTEGWWKFADRDLRPSHPLLSQDKWVALLQETGFSQAVAIPEAKENRRGFSQPAVILARGPAVEGKTERDQAELAVEKQRGKWLIFADRGEVGKNLADALSLRGEDCLLAFAGNVFEHSENGNWTLDPGRPRDFQQLLQEVVGKERPGFHGVVHLWGLDTPPTAEMTVGSLEEAQILSCGSVLHLVQALAKEGGSTPPRLWLVTRGAQPVGAEAGPLAVAQAPLWGLGRVVALEHPALHCVCVDLDPSGRADQTDALLRELWAGLEENQVSFRTGARHVARLVRSEAGVQASEGQLQAPGDQPFQLHIASPGVLDNLVLRPSLPRPPGPGEVQIRVHTTGLNFRDVLNALGTYPGEAGPLGLECAGKIVALGDGVESFEIGDEVIALAAGSFSTLVTTPAELVVQKPAGLSYDEAATIPVAFLTAYYALHHLARISPGDRVLIHAAAGGVGMAAVQLAQQAGAVIFATAGSSEKRNCLRLLGIPHVMNSRSLDFAEEVMERTGGQGVDIVLNSLAGEFIPKSLSLLRANGRFLEIGKTGIWDEGRVAQHKSNISYFVIAFDQMIVDKSAFVGTMLDDLVEKFREGILKPLPRRIFPIEEARSAFRYMAQAKHTGKIVVTLNGHADTAPSFGPISFRSDATYLVTGGLGGLGLLLARWMVDRGARHLVLLGRNAPSSTALGTVSKLQEAGAQIVIVQADVSREQEVAKVLREMGATMPPLGGIFHCAGLLNDGLLRRQDWAGFARVMAAKVSGAWNLHVLTKGMPLDFFVLFSSIASLLGSPGQGNHAAANAFLDALAHDRHAHGLAALSVNWGGWAEVGAAARRNTHERAPMGMDTIPPKKGLQVLEQVLQEGYVQVGVMPVNWQEFTQQFSAQNIPPLLSDLVRESRQGAGAAKPATPPSELLRKLQEAPPSERRALLLSHVRNQATKVLGIDTSTPLDERKPLNEVGLDSLMAIELRNVLGIAAGRTLPATLLFDYPTVESLSDYLAREVFSVEFLKSSHPQAQNANDKPVGVSTRLDELSDEEMAALLAQKLAAIESGDLT
ncbi:MAG TPA: SDR family NAD(P)-dependent oxidoreductase [Terriglobia bacterium]|nr:SDR family NAD(P)-dependent oxidoreductase [Terriglobia bacterium]